MIATKISTLLKAAALFGMGLATGATLMNLKDAKHGGFKVVGDVPLKLFTVHIVDKSQPWYDYAK